MTAAAVIDAQIEAYRARDLDRFLSFFAHDVVVTNFDGVVLMDGVEAMRDHYAPLFADSPDLTVEITSRIEAGSFVVDLEHLEGFHMAPYPESFDAGCVYRVAGDKIAAMKFLL
jgi:hypothetical protein